MHDRRTKRAVTVCKSPSENVHFHICVFTSELRTRLDLRQMGGVTSTLQREEHKGQVNYFTIFVKCYLKVLFVPQVFCKPSH